MLLDFPAIEAQLHHETYVAMLEAALRQRGEKTRFARETGQISRVSLSYITRGQRRLSVQKARELAPLLPFSPAMREAFLEHVRAQDSAQLRLQTMVAQHARDADLPAFLASVRKATTALSASPDLPTHGARLQAIRDLCRQALAQIRPRGHPLEFADICLLFCNAQGVLDRPDEALFYSKVGLDVLDSLNGEHLRVERERYDTLLIDMLRAQASAYHIMNLAKWSYCTSEAALVRVLTLGQRPYLSEIHLLVTQLRAALVFPRFGIRAARVLADTARACADQLPEEDGYRVQRVNIDRALGEMESKYGQYQRAERLLQPLAAAPPAQVGISPVLYAGILRSYAQHRFAQGDTRAGNVVLQKVLDQAKGEGLAHQLRQNRIQFGPRVDMLLGGRDS